MNVLGFPGGSAIKNLPAMKEIQETQVWSLGLGDSLEEEMSTLSSIIAWKSPWTEEPGGLQSRELQRVINDWVTEHTHRDHGDECIKVKEYTIEKLKKKDMNRDHHKRAVIFCSNHRDEPYIALCFLVPSKLENNHFYNSQCPWDQHPLAQGTEDYSWYWVWRYISPGCSHKVSTG